MEENGLSLQVSIMGSKWDINDFSRDNNFGLWKRNMQAILTQQR